MVDFTQYLPALSNVLVILGFVVGVMVFWTAFKLGQKTAQKTADHVIQTTKEAVDLAVRSEREIRTVMAQMFALQADQQKGKHQSEAEDIRKMMGVMEERTKYEMERMKEQYLRETELLKKSHDHEMEMQRRHFEILTRQLEEKARADEVA